MAKSEPTRNQTFTVSTSSSIVQNLVASKRREILRRPVEKIGQVQGNLTRKNTIKTQRRVLSRMAKRCISGCRYEETRRNRRRPGTLEFHRRFKKYEETLCFGKLRHRRQTQILAKQSPYIKKLRAAHGEGFLDRETKIWSQPDGSNEGPPGEHSFMVYIDVRHSSSCSSPWYRLYGESAIDQQSI